MNVMWCRRAGEDPERLRKEGRAVFGRGAGLLSRGRRRQPGEAFWAHLQERRAQQLGHRSAGSSHRSCKGRGRSKLTSTKRARAIFMPGRRSDLREGLHISGAGVAALEENTRGTQP